MPRDFVHLILALNVRLMIFLFSAIAINYSICLSVCVCVKEIYDAFLKRNCLQRTLVVTPSVGKCVLLTDILETSCIFFCQP